jgi:CspA family cold shock protein
LALSFAPVEFDPVSSLSKFGVDRPHGFTVGEGCAPIQRKAMATGTVKWFNTQKGYGFIQPDDGSKDVFVHISAVERSGIGSLRDGQKIAYDVVQDRGKPAATNLKLG